MDSASIYCTGISKYHWNKRGLVLKEFHHVLLVSHGVSDESGIKELTETDAEKPREGGSCCVGSGMRSGGRELGRVALRK